MSVIGLRNMEKNMEKFVDILKNAKLCALVLDENPKEESFLLQSALCLSLEKVGIETLSLPAESDAVLRYREKWARILKDRGAAKEKAGRKNIIKIPKKDILIKEMAYDEDDEFFSLVITSKNGLISKDSFIVEECLPAPDAFLCFFDNTEKLNKLVSEVKIPEQKETVFLFEGDAAAKAVAFSRLLEDELAPDTASLFFAALVIETGGFKDLSDKNIFSLANFLLSQGADAKGVIAVLNDEKTDSFVQLLGRGAARTQYDENLEVLWSFLQASDFEKTKNAPSLNLVLRLVREMAHIVRNAKTRVFLWQKENQVWAILMPREKETILNLADFFNLRINSDYLIAGPYENFSEAEIKTRDGLREIKFKEKKDFSLNGKERELGFDF